MSEPEYMSIPFVSSTVPPEDELISNVNAVPKIGDQWVVIRLANGNWEIPGGTLEPGENPMAALARELLEEAGTEILSTRFIGAWEHHSKNPEPYRLHLPHPISYRAVYLCDVKIVGLPTSGPDQENVEEICILSLPEVKKRFLSVDREDLANIYQIAGQLAQAK